LESGWNLSWDEFLPVVGLDLEHFKAPHFTSRDEDEYYEHLAQIADPASYPMAAKKYQRPGSSQLFVKHRKVELDHHLSIGARTQQVPMVVTDPGTFRYRFLVESGGSDYDKNGIVVAAISPADPQLKAQIVGSTRFETEFDKIIELDLRIDGTHARNFSINFYASDNEEDFNVGELRNIHCGSVDFKVRPASKVGLELVKFVQSLKEEENYEIGFDWSSTNPEHIKTSQDVALKILNCGGVCYATASSRANEAFRRVLGKPVLDLKVDPSNMDHRICSAQPDCHPFWSYGVGGAIARKGYGTRLTEAQCWGGELQPGSPIQIWFDYKNPNTPKQYKKMNSGHSYLFREYIFNDNGSLSGMVYVDNHDFKRLDKVKDFTENPILGTNLLDVPK